MNYYDFALKDFKSAEIMHKYTEEYDVIVVSCQQYLEKSLKRLLELKNGELLKTHKLHTLMKKLNNEELNRYKNLFLEVEDFYFDKRYPGEDYIETTKEDCDRVFEETKQVKIVIEKLLKDLNKPNDTEIKKVSFLDDI